MKKLGCSKNISMCRRDMKLESPILTSTSPRELFRPMVTRFWRTIYSNSRPCILAIAVPDFHCTLEGLGDVDFRANNAQASLSLECEWTDITWIEKYPNQIGLLSIEMSLEKKMQNKTSLLITWNQNKNTGRHSNHHHLKWIVYPSPHSNIQMWVLKGWRGGNVT